MHTAPALPPPQLLLVLAVSAAFGGLVGWISIGRVTGLARGDRVLAAAATVVAVPVLAATQPLLGAQLVAGALAAGTTPLAVIDARTRRLPNPHLAGAGIALAAALAAAALLDTATGSWIRALSAAVVCGAGFAALYCGVPGQLGGGDVKLAAVLGAALGHTSWTAVLTGMLAGFTLAALAHLVTTLLGHHRDTLPLGPYLITAAQLTLLIT